jgi:hypothetical protein
MYVYIRSVHVCVYVYVYMCMAIRSLIGSTRVYVYVCVCVSVIVRSFIKERACMCIRVCTYVCGCKILDWK